MELARDSVGEIMARCTSRGVLHYNTHAQNGVFTRECPAMGARGNYKREPAAWETRCLNVVAPKLATLPRQPSGAVLIK